MSVVASFKISNWNKELYDPVDLSIPELVDYFTANYNLSKLSKDINSLKYIDKEAKLTVSSMKSKFVNNPVSKVLTVNDDLSLPVKQWFENNCSEKFMEDIEIVTFPNVLSTIMNTPFEINDDKKKWKLSATLKSNKIFLIPRKAENVVTSAYTCKYQGYYVSRPCQCRRGFSNCRDYKIQSTPEVPKWLEHYDLMKRYLFVKKPENLHRNILSKWDKLFYEVYQLNIGDNKVLYVSEIPGVSSEQKLNTIEGLKSADHIYCDISEIGEFTQEIINYNPIWWSRAHLINAKQCFIGFYNNRKDGLQEILNFNTNKFEHITQYENLWSPTAAWNFLDEVLSFIKDQVYRIDPEYRNSCSWEFQSYENDQPFVTAIPYGANKASIPTNYIN